MFSEIHCVIQGKVHGVGYRDFVEKYANEHGLFGWVKNIYDTGSVELVLQGTPDELKDCIEMLNMGPSLARVETMSVDWRTPEQLFDEFKVISS